LRHFNFIIFHLNLKKGRVSTEKILKRSQINKKNFKKSEKNHESLPFNLPFPSDSLHLSEIP